MNEKKELLAEIKAYIERVIKNLPDITNVIRNGENIKSIPELIEGITFVLQVFASTKDICSINFDIEMIKALSADVLDGMENEDYGLVADIFEYEFLPMFEEWNDSLNNFFAK